MAKKRSSTQVAKPSSAWLATFSDMLMLLLTFFVMLVAMSALDQQKLQDMFGFFKGAVASMEPAKAGGGKGSGHVKSTAIMTTKIKSAFDFFTNSVTKTDEGSSFTSMQQVEYVVGLAKKLLEELGVVYGDRDIGAKGLKPLDARINDLMAGAIPVDVVQHAGHLEFKIHMGLMFEQGSRQLRKNTQQFIEEIKKLAAANVVIRRVDIPIAEVGNETRTFSQWDLAAWRSGALARALNRGKGMIAGVIGDGESNYARIWMSKTMDIPKQP